MRMNQPKKRQDEVLEDDGEAGGGETEDGWDLTGRSEDDEKNQEQGNELNGEDRDGAEGVEAAAIHGGALKEHARGGCEKDAEKDEEADGGE